MRRENDPKLQWLLGRLVDDTGATHAIAASKDGLALGSSSAMITDDDTELAAQAAAVVSLSAQTACLFRAGSGRQTIMELDNAFLLFTAAGELSCLAVRAPHEVNVGLLSHEVNLLVAQVGDHLGTGVRAVTDR
jgi:predicted regulator of Ras-like GTPase activity (Roadblock/LC7/MglB family)